MANNFTDKAEKALNYSVKIAEEFGHSYIGSEHILRALVEDTMSCSYTLLTKNGVSKEKIDTAIKDYSGIGSKSKLSAKDMTPRCRRIIEGSYKNAVKYSSLKIGTEHLLLSVLEERDCIAYKILNYIGADTVTLKDELITFLRASDKSATNSKKSTSGLQFLNQYGNNLNQLAKNDLLDPVIGRDAETERLIRILTRRTKNNPCLIGEAGVGKTAIVEGLALKIAQGLVPEQLKNKQIYSVDLTSMVAGAKYRGDFEERIKNIIAEASNNSNVILFIDEIHTIVGAGAAEGAIDAANILKPELSRSKIQLIGATTLSEYHKYIEKDPALERRFQPLIIKEASLETTIDILRNLRKRYETHHNVIIADEALIQAAKLSERYIQDRFLPDKALDILDEACAKANVASVKSKLEIKNTHVITGQTDRNIINEETISTEAISEKMLKDKENIQKNVLNKSPSYINENDIKEIITEITGIPITSLNEEENIKNLKTALENSVVGQDHAIDVLTGAVIRGRMGINAPQRPRGVFLFLGESGVGKTELAKALSYALFSTEKALIRFDMSEYGEKHSVSKLIGSPPGYVGYEEGGNLTEKVRRNPYSVILFDEIEKASFEVLNLLLQVMDEGKLTDSLGRSVSFINTFIILTSNIGAEGFSKGAAGFLADQHIKLENIIIDKLKEHFRPEFINRIDEIIPFSALSLKELKEIARKNLNALKNRLSDINVELIFDENVCCYIADRGKLSGFGARPISRIITTEIENPISTLLINISRKPIYIKISHEENGLIIKLIENENKLAIPIN